MEENILKTIGDKIVNIAPSISALLTASGVGAPVGLAVTALASLGKAFGLGSNATPDEIHQAISSDPESALKLALADQDFQLKMRDQDLKELQARLADVQSARDRQIDHEKVTGKSDINLYALAWLFVAGFFITIIAMVGLILTKSMPESMPKEIVFLLGSLFQCLTMGVGVVLQYFFGSSKGSNEKTGLLAKADAIKN